MSVAAVVVHWNSRDDLPGCLGALGDLPGLTTVVVDNASPDGGEDLVRREFPHVRWIPMGRNAGFGAAVNAGARATRTDWILALNPDTTLSGDTALRMAAEAEALGADALGPRILDPEGSTERSYSTRDSLLGDFLWMLAWRAGRAARPARAPREAAWLTGACLLLGRAAFERAGGFDESYFLYFEDADLCRRLRMRGGRVLYHPGFTAVHRRGASPDTEGARERAYRSSQIRFASRHRTPLARRIVECNVALRAWLGGRK